MANKSLDFISLQDKAALAGELEMNIWTGLLFLEGAVADASLARELADDTAHGAPASTPAHINESRPARDASATDRWVAGTGQY